jgi:phasin family protein
MTKSTKTGAAGKVEAEGVNDSLRSAFQIDVKAFDSALKEGADAAAKGFEKFTVSSREGIETSVQRYDDAVAAGRANLDAFAVSAEAFVEAVEQINSFIIDYTHKTVVASMAATEGAFGAKDPAEAVKIQRETWQAGIAGLVEDSTRLSEITLAAANRSLVPLNDRVTQVVKQATGAAR